MGRRTEAEKKIYQTGTSGWRILTWGMLFVSAMLIFSGVIGHMDPPYDLTVIPSLTPQPTAVSSHFDETPDSRQITVGLKGWHGIQLGIFTSLEAAQSQAESFRARGAAGFLWQDGQRWRVLAAVYEDKQDADAVREQLRDTQQIDSYIFSNEPREATLALTGLKGQLDLVEACFQCIGGMPWEIQKMSLRLDRQETDAREIAQVLEGLENRLNELLLLLKERFINPGHSMILQMTSLLEKWRQSVHELAAGQESLALLAGKIKYVGIEMMHSGQEFFEFLLK
ncbi:MAG: SPOR domain-containing protein [Bacillota bacterium]|nr:SPOR domain-containing protein [Bacillota bacterium]